MGGDGRERKTALRGEIEVECGGVEQGVGKVISDRQHWEFWCHWRAA